tara:strand:- start:7074 stop:7313 length:240 start_codon:yes stop_codon:yes gene_type:complete
MAKKKKSSGYRSQGLFPTQSRSVTKASRREYMQSDKRIANQLKAHKLGKRVMLTIKNPDKSDTKQRYIRVPSTEVWKSV